jgi:hypothetical protein
MNVIGLDIAKNSLVACLLTEKPQDIREHFPTVQFYQFKADAEGIAGLLALKPDVAVIEPTGTNYSKIWVETLIQYGCEVRLVDHRKSKFYRQSLTGLPKDDQIDSYALALYYYDYSHVPNRFVSIREKIISELLELTLRLGHLNRAKSPIINRLRQDLAWQFPEVMDTRSPKMNDTDPPLLWGWMAGIRESKKYDLLYEKTIGQGLKENSRFLAKQLCDFEEQIWKTEKQIAQILADERFTKYIKAFKKFSFGQYVQAVLLAKIYPIERFLGYDGKPEVRISKGRISKKPTKKYLSLRRFQKIVGFAPATESSGKRTKKIGTSAGSVHCRKAVWLWVFSAVEPKKKRISPILQELGETLDKLKNEGKSVNLVRTRIGAIAIKRLFHELTKPPTDDEDDNITPPLEQMTDDTQDTDELELILTPDN